MLDKYTLDLFQNSIYSLKRQFLASLSPNFSLISLDMTEKLGNKSTKKLSAFPSKASFERGLFFSFFCVFILVTSEIQAHFQAPQRAERPVPAITYAISPIISRPATALRALPCTVIIDQRSALYPYTTLTPVRITKKGDEIQLDNGSHWKVRHRDQPSCRKWKTGDAILIESGKIFSWSIYKLVNFTRNESIDVELIEPINHGTLSHWIAEVQPFEGYLRLQNGSMWKVSMGELMKWKVGDDVVIAISKNLFSHDFSYVLINLRAKNRLVAVFIAEPEPT